MLDEAFKIKNLNYLTYFFSGLRLQGPTKKCALDMLAYASVSTPIKFSSRILSPLVTLLAEDLLKD